MTLYLGAYTIQVGIPYFDATLNSIDYKYVTMPLFWDSNTNTVDADTLLSQMMSTNARNPIWLDTVDDRASPPIDLRPGVIVAPAPNLGALAINLDTVGDQISRHWVGSDRATYGTVRGMREDQKSELFFIDSKSKVFQFVPGSFTSVEITILPGCFGHALTFQWSGIPPLQYNFAGQGWNYFAGFFPWYGKTKPLPGQ